MKKAIQIANAPAPIGPYSQAIKANNMLFISGQIAINPKTGELNDENIIIETTQVMENLKALLGEANLDFSNVVKCSIFLSSMNNFTTVNEIYSSYFDAPFPARETVEVSCLPKNVNVEISLIAIE